MGCRELDITSYYQFVSTQCTPKKSHSHAPASYCTPKNAYSGFSHTVVSGYRYYDANMGRWINRDLIAESGGVNLYVMVFNNPIKHYDYLGLSVDNESETLTPKNVKVRITMAHDCKWNSEKGRAALNNQWNAMQNIYKVYANISFKMVHTMEDIKIVESDLDDIKINDSEREFRKKYSQNIIDLIKKHDAKYENTVLIMLTDHLTILKEDPNFFTLTPTKPSGYTFPEIGVIVLPDYQIKDLRTITLTAHEMGHILGLAHKKGTLMGSGIEKGREPTLLLDNTQIKTVRKSSFSK